MRSSSAAAPERIWISRVSTAETHCGSIPLDGAVNQVVVEEEPGQEISGEIQVRPRGAGIGHGREQGELGLQEATMLLLLCQAGVPGGGSSGRYRQSPKSWKAAQ